MDKLKLPMVIYRGEKSSGKDCLLHYLNFLKFQRVLIEKYL